MVVNMTSKATIIVVDDDPAVLQAIARDLRKQYGDRFALHEPTLVQPL